MLKSNEKFGLLPWLLSVPAVMLSAFKTLAANSLVVIVPLAIFEAVISLDAILAAVIELAASLSVFMAPFAIWVICADYFVSW